MSKEAIFSFILWVVNGLLLILMMELNYKTGEMRKNLENLERKISDMRLWAKEINEIKGQKQNNIGILEFVEQLSKEYGINFESARPSGNQIEITSRGIEPSKAINFIWKLEKSGRVSIRKLRLKKNIVDSNLNDIELFIEAK